MTVAGAHVELMVDANSGYTAGQAGFTIVAIILDGQPVGAIAVADPPRADARHAVAALRTLTEHDVVMLTGDGQGSAQSIGEQIGLRDVRARLLPAKKLDAVLQLGTRVNA